MFDITQLKDLAGEAYLHLIGEPKEKLSLEESLGEFVKVWESKECQNYLGSFGKLIFMSNNQLTQEQRNSMAEQNYRALSYGKQICFISKLKRFNHPDLETAIFGIYTYIPLIEQSAKEIDNSFIK